MQIIFDGLHTINSNTFGINFSAKVDGQGVICTVSTEALQDVDPSNAKKTAEQQFIANRSYFETIATKKILAEGSSPVIKITSVDLSH